MMIVSDDERMATDACQPDQVDEAGPTDRWTNRHPFGNLEALIFPGDTVTGSFGTRRVAPSCSSD